MGVWIADGVLYPASPCSKMVGQQGSIDMGVAYGIARPRFSYICSMSAASDACEYIASILAFCAASSRCLSMDCIISTSLRAITSALPEGGLSLRGGVYGREDAALDVLDSPLNSGGEHVPVERCGHGSADPRPDGIAGGLLEESVDG